MEGRQRRAGRGEMEEWGAESAAAVVGCSHNLAASGHDCRLDEFPKLQVDGASPSSSSKTFPFLRPFRTPTPSHTHTQPTPLPLPPPGVGLRRAHFFRFMTAALRCV